MKLNGLHLLLTYQCTFECDHCFAWGSPWQSGTMTLENIRRILHQAHEMDSVEWIYFEGGEPFLYYAVLVKGVEMAATGWIPGGHRQQWLLGKQHGRRPRMAKTHGSLGARSIRQQRFVSLQCKDQPAGIECRSGSPTIRHSGGNHQHCQARRGGDCCMRSAPRRRVKGDVSRTGCAEAG